MIIDPPIHLTQYNICKREPHCEPSVTVPVWLNQSRLDGLQTLIQFCKGMERSGQGIVPGSFELVMFYRTLRSSIDDAERLAEMMKYK